MAVQNRVYLLLGSNLNDREHLLSMAIKELALRIGEINRTSSIYETEPWGFESSEPFLNQVVRVATSLSPKALMKEIIRIELNLGRKRNASGYASRTIDIDILLYGDKVIKEDGLTIPHPRMAERLFTLIPLGEIDGNLIHPVLGITISELIRLCVDQGRVDHYESRAVKLTGDEV